MGEKIAQLLEENRMDVFPGLQAIADDVADLVLQGIHDERFQNHQDGILQVLTENPSVSEFNFELIGLLVERRLAEKMQGAKPWREDHVHDDGLHNLFIAKLPGADQYKLYDAVGDSSCWYHAVLAAQDGNPSQHM